MATKLNVSENQEKIPLTVSTKGGLRTITPDDGSPYYVGARAYVTQNVDGATVTVIDKDGTTTANIYNGQDGAAGQDGADGADGFSPTATVSKVGDTATISITDVNGTTTATVTDGADGYSPSASVTKVGSTATITITDKDGTTTASISDGSGGGASAFVAELNVTTYADVKDAYDDDAILICTIDDSGNTMVLQLVYFDDANEIFYFAFPMSDGWLWTQLSNADGWDTGQWYFASTDVATQLADGLMSALDKQKLDGLSKRNIWYGTSSTSASSSPKTITTASGDFSLTAGNMLVVLFSHTNSLSSVSLQVDGGTSKSAYAMDGTSDISNRWGSNEVVSFVYDGTKFVMLEQGLASTTAYGITKLNNTVTSTSTSEAATAKAVKTAYDNGGVQSVNGSTGAVSLSIHNVPSGGTSGQVLSKASGTDYDLAWATPSSGSVTDVEVDGTSVVSGGVASIDLTGKSDVGHTHTKSAITDFPTTVSSFTNDAGYITGYTETDPIFLASAAHGISSSDISNWNGKSDFSGSYNDLTDKPTIPTVNNATLTIQKNGSTVKTFTANASSNVTANITVPTKTSDLSNDSGYITGYTETDPVFSASAASGITSSDISDWNAKSEVSVTRHTTTGTNIADLTIDGTTTKLYAPTGGGGGGTVTDVWQNGSSVLDGTVGKVNATLVQIVRW